MRRGRLRILRQLVDDSPEVAQDIYAQILPFRVELMYEFDAFDVLALSPHFDEISPGQLTPEYVAINDGGKIRFERQP